MELPITTETDYKLKEIKLMYTKETKHEKGKHRDYLEEQGWSYIGYERTDDKGIFMKYIKQKEISRGVRMTDTTTLEKIKL